MSKKINLPNVTLVSISGVNIRSTLYALWRSSLKINFGKVLLITDQNVEINNTKIEVKKISDFKLNSVDAYSYYCVYKLHSDIDTDYALLIQADGFVINPKLWRNNYLNYDYIGAPFELVDNAYVDPFGKHQRVGNGGFSLRSYKLLSTPLRQKINWNVNEGNFYNHMGANSQNEDGIICIHNRHLYEADGNLFAPLDIALQFSFERKIPEYFGQKTFGFHKNFPSKKVRIANLAYKLFFNLNYSIKL